VLVVIVIARDEQMMEWFKVIRITNMQGIRWVLGALNGWDEPVSLRQAQGWCARMEKAGLIERARIAGVGGSLVWATHSAIGKSAPDLFRQTTRHEVAVSIASARYAAAGYSWQRDEKAASSFDHQTDGVAWQGDVIDLVEVELTAKRQQRYRGIFAAFRRRMSAGAAIRVTYLCTPDAARAVQTAMDDPSIGAGVSQWLHVEPVFDRTGLWVGDEQPEWLHRAEDDLSEVGA
jgi:hypothetical protein